MGAQGQILSPASSVSDPESGTVLYWNAHHSGLASEHPHESQVQPAPPMPMPSPSQPLQFHVAPGLWRNSPIPARGSSRGQLDISAAQGYYHRSEDYLSDMEDPAWPRRITQPPPVVKVEESAHGTTDIPSNALPTTPSHRPMTECQGTQVGVTEEAPIYVNAKQFNRIVKRRVVREEQRVAREKQKQGVGSSKQRRGYIHESRHKQAMRRPRGPGGRFI